MPCIPSVTTVAPPASQMSFPGSLFNPRQPCGVLRDERDVLVRALFHRGRENVLLQGRVRIAQAGPQARLAGVAAYQYGVEVLVRPTHPQHFAEVPRAGLGEGPEQICEIVPIVDEGVDRAVLGGYEPVNGTGHEVLRFPHLQPSSSDADCDRACRRAHRRRWRRRLVIRRFGRPLRYATSGLPSPLSTGSPLARAR